VEIADNSAFVGALLDFGRLWAQNTTVKVLVRPSPSIPVGSAALWQKGLSYDELASQLSEWISATNDQAAIASEPDLPIRPCVIHRWMEHSNSFCIAMDGCNPVGFVTATESESNLPSGTIELCHLIVKPSQRRAGIATQLISTQLDHLGRAGFQRVIGRIVANNNGSISLTRYLRWKPVSDKLLLRRLDPEFIWMQRNLR
jgi:GNAT superfamily N-acetyltransferase